MALERQTGSRMPENDVNAFLDQARNAMFLDTIGNLTLKYLSGHEHPDAVIDVRTLSLEEAVTNACRTHFGFVDELDAFEARISRDLFGDGSPAIRERFENRSQDRFGPEDLTARNRDLLLERTRYDRKLDTLLRELLAARVELDRGTARAVAAHPA